MDELREILNALWLTDEIHWDISLYVLLVLNLILLLQQPDAQPLATGLCIIVLVAIVIDKVKAFGYMFPASAYYTREQCHEQIFIGTYLIRAVIFAAPLSVAGMTKNPDSRPVGIIAGVLGGAYMFVRWFLEQRDVPLDDLFCTFLFTGFALQQGGLLLLASRVALRDRLLLGRVHRHAPVLITLELAADEVEVERA
ncbi:MAG: hypothetical protein GX613_10855 [Chloroflexi bacterium]|nr:hypothetical protein [Chloroflexota bacterium]